MTSEELQNIYSELVKEYGDKLPNPEHCPKTFAYYVKLFLHFKNIRKMNAEHI